MNDKDIDLSENPDIGIDHPAHTTLRLSDPKEKNKIEYIDQFEMLEIRKNRPLKKSLHRGNGDAQRGRGRFF